MLCRELSAAPKAQDALGPLYWDREGRPRRAGPEGARSIRSVARPQEIPRQQIYQWIWKRGVTDFDAMTNLGPSCATALAETATVSLPEVVKHDVSTTARRNSCCDSPTGGRSSRSSFPTRRSRRSVSRRRSGCAMGCAFCLTGKMGLIRHLTAAEIAGQVRLLARSTTSSTSRFNIVLMGMGEPLHNYDATMKALRMLNEKEGLDMHPKRVTLSTVGLVPMMDKLAQEDADAEPGRFAARRHRGAARGHRAARTRSTPCRTSSTPASGSRSPSAAASCSST